MASKADKERKRYESLMGEWCVAWPPRHKNGTAFNSDEIAFLRGYIKRLHGARPEEVYRSMTAEFEEEAVRLAPDLERIWKDEYWPLDRLIGQLQELLCLPAENRDAFHQEARDFAFAAYAAGRLVLREAGGVWVVHVRDFLDWVLECGHFKGAAFDGWMGLGRVVETLPEAAVDSEAGRGQVKRGRRQKFDSHLDDKVVSIWRCFAGKCRNDCERPTVQKFFNRHQKDLKATGMKTPRDVRCALERARRRGKRMRGHS